jgi:pimeloyl-ACP methyl ester carboxylesterase
LAPLDAGKTLADLARTVVAAMGPNPDIVGRALASPAIAATPEGTYRAAVHCLVGFDERANLAAIGIPILCLAGEHDLLAPPYACLSGVGHFANLEAPAAFDAVLFAFLAQVPEQLMACA